MHRIPAAERRARISSLAAHGSTEMREAILAALEPLRPSSQRQVVLITDGLIGFESEIVSSIPGLAARAVCAISLMNSTIAASAQTAAASVSWRCGCPARKAASRASHTGQ